MSRNPILDAQIFSSLRTNKGHKEIAKIFDCSIHTVRRLSAIKPVRVLLIADLHCGSNVGLTPPAYQYKIIQHPDTEEHAKRNKWAQLQIECWEWYVRTLNLINPVDKCFVLGDLIDGTGLRSGGTELITTDRKVQTCMAIEALESIQTGGMIFVYGTPYHTGQTEDWETDISHHFGCKIGAHEWEDVNGVIFDLKHKQSNTKNPATSLFNEIVDNREWALSEEQPKANVLVRAHTHRFCSLQLEDCLAISLPALQSFGSKFGARQCTRRVHFGFIVLDVWPDGFIQPHVFIAKLHGHKAQSNQELK